MPTADKTTPIADKEPSVLAKKNPPIIEQVNPDVKVLISLSWYVSQTWTTVATGSSSPSGSGYNLWTEYWALDSTFLTELTHVTTSDTMTLAPQTYASPWPSAPFTNPTVSLWTELASAPSGAVFAYVDAPNNTYIALSFNLTSGSPWTGSIQWLVAAPTSGSGPSTGIIGSSSTTLTYASAAPTLPSGYSWFYQRLPALIWPSAGSVIGDTVTGTALATMGSNTYLAYVKSSGVINVRSSSTGSSWSGSADTSISHAKAGPALAALGSTLYLVYNDDHGSDQDHLKQITSTDGTTWSSAVDTGATSGGTPSLANVVSGFSNTLCLAYADLSTSSTIRTRAWSGTAWSSASTAATNATGAASLAAFGGSLYMAVATSSGIEVSKATSVSGSGVTWPGSGNPIATLTPPSGTWSGPGLSVWQGQLALTFQDGSGHVWACFSSDGILWSGYQDLTTQVTTIATSVAPAMGALGNTLIVSINGTVSGSTGLGTIATT